MTAAAPDDRAAALQRLTDVEAIEQLKARYFRLIDTKDWAAFRALFTDDCRHLYVDADGSERFMTNEVYFPMMEATLADGVTTHHGHSPEITFASDTDAAGIWAMFDYVQAVQVRAGQVRADGPADRVSIMGWGHYHETYRKGDDGRWRIASKRNVRQRVDEVPWTRPQSEGTT